jgi:thiamine biosynthesis lipoprotein
MGASHITRRRALTILAGTTAGLAGGFAESGAKAADHEWSGYAMGTDARIIFSGTGVEAARAAAELATAEIERLEKALSLFRAESEITRLNRDGILPAATGDMLRAVRLGLDIASATNGLFDPTVQALWECYVDWFSVSPNGDLPPQPFVAKALNAVDWRTIRLSGSSIVLGDNQRITLNGLGQGYVTDRIANLLRGRGFNHVLVDLGEQRALGIKHDGTPWLVARHGLPGIELRHGALATSEGAGCILGAKGAVHHLFDPRTGNSSNRWRTLTVHHRSAAVADALSTALYSASPDEIANVVTKLDGLIVWASDGSGRESRWQSTIGATGAKSMDAA